MTGRSGDAWVLGKPYRGRERRRRGALLAAATAFFVFAGTVAAFGSVRTDQDDYAPGSVVTISGDNGNGAGYLPGETVRVDVSGPNGYASSCEGVADDAGAWSCQVALWDSLDAVGSYSYVATGLTSGVTETGAFSDAITINSFASNCTTASDSFTSGTTVCAKGSGLPGGGGGSSGKIEWWAPGAASATRTTTFSGVSGNFTDTFAPAACGTWTLKIYSPAATLQDDDTFEVTGCDSTPPVISKTISGTLGDGGWYTSNVTVAWTVTDAESAVVIDSGCGTQNFTSETTGTTSSCSAHSAGGSASDSVSLKIDKTGPTAVLSASGTLGSNGWYVSNVTISTAGNDPVSGGVTCTADQHQNADTAGTEFNGSCTNAAGLTTNAAPLTVKVDQTAPTIDFALDPVPNTEGWNKDNPVTVSYTCDDDTSGLDPAYGNDGGGCWNDDSATSQGLTSFVNRAVFDMAGNTASVSPSVRIDTDPPVINQGATSGTAGDNGWYLSDVTVDFTAYDSLSGLKVAGDASFSLTASGEGASVSTGSRDVSDKADNVATAGPLTFMIDKGAPVVECDDPSSAWSAIDIVVNCTAEDVVSGLADPGDATFTLSTNVPAGTETDTASTGSRTVCDVSGRCTTVGPFTGLKVDKRAPEVACGSADTAWHATNQSVNCTATDGGSGVVDDSFTLSTNVADGVETDSAYTDSDTALDAVGNSTAVGPVGPFKIDRKAPEVACGSADTAWHADDVSILCWAVDFGSGPLFASEYVSTSVPSGTEDANASTGTHEFCDDVANCATAGPVVGNKVDKKGPSIDIVTPGDGSSHVLNQTVSSDFSCSDGGSGLASCTGPATVDTSSVGSHGFTVDATDDVGNASTETHSYTVTYATGGTCLGQPGHQVLQPVNANGSSVFKRNSTVPVKFRVCDANGVSIGTPGIVTGTGAPVLVSKTNGAGGVDEAVYSTTPDTAFRWDATAQQWIFNQNTKNLVSGVIYTFKIPLNDGTDIVYTFGVR
jgi:hypothetical protein